MTAAFSKFNASAAAGHFVLQAVDDRVGMPVKESAKIIDQLTVIRLVDGTDAWTAAQLDVKIQAWSGVQPGDLAVAGEIGEDTPQQIKRLVHCPHAGVRTKIPGSVRHHLAGYRYLGERLVKVHFDIRITLVIFQAAH